MNNKAIIFVFAFSLLTAILTPAQETAVHCPEFPSGISLGYGIGSYGVKDEYISKEKYSGYLPHFNLEWVRFRKKSGYRLEFEYWNSTHISNNNISAEAQQFNFNQDFFYPIGDFSLFSKSVYAYLGPSAQLFYYEIYYHFVSPGTFISPTTLGLMGSLGVNTQFVYHVTHRLKLECFLRSNLISVTYKRFDMQEFEEGSNPTLLTAITSTKLDVELSMRYYLLNRVSVSLGYKSDLSRINKWDPYVAAISNVVFSVNFKI